MLIFHYVLLQSIPPLALLHWISIAGSIPNDKFVQPCQTETEHGFAFISDISVEKIRVFVARSPEYPGNAHFSICITAVVPCSGRCASATIVSMKRHERQITQGLPLWPCGDQHAALSQPCKKFTHKRHCLTSKPPR